MRKIPHWFTGLSCAVALSMAIPSFAQTPGALPQDDVLGYMEQLIQWQRNAVAIDPGTSIPRERIFQDTLEQTTTKAMRNGFKFAQAQANLNIPAPQEENTDEQEEQTPRQRIQQRLSIIANEISQLKTKLAVRNLPAAQRTKLEGSLKLATAKQELYQTVINNMAANTGGSGKDLQNKLGNLARETPELTVDLAKAKKEKAPDDNSPTTLMTPIGSVTVPAAPADTTTRSSNSIFGLMGDLFSNIRKQRELKDFNEQTDQLVTSSRALLKGLREQLEAINGSDTTGIPIDTQVANFKQIGGQILPLGETLSWINTSNATLHDWQSTLDKRFESLLRSLGLQILLLAITVMIPIVLGNFAKRAIKRYVIDPKRKRQANNARRIMVGVAIVFILLLNFISDFGSFATFAGFLTAGLAVALQSVLLSLVGHFFFYGRYGVRPGDRVKVAGVVGDIIQIGMMRFYLRELHAGEDGELKATGKIVTFPNSILFQPAAFYKYLSEMPR